MAAKIVQRFLSNNDCYKAGKLLRVKGLMLHSVGCPQPSAEVFLSSWNQPGVKACVHGFIDANSGDVYQTLPWNYCGWHGGGTSNNSHIGVEMCEPNSIVYTRNALFVDKDPERTKATVFRTYQSAVSLFSMLCRKYQLDPRQDGVVISHREGYRRGIATNHGDPEHLWHSFGLTMDGFRSDVLEAMGEAGKLTDQLSFQIRVTVNSLNIRTGPGISYPISGQIKDHGIYTIMQEADGWGKLKSGMGWISLSCTEKI